MLAFLMASCLLLGGCSNSWEANPPTARAGGHGVTHTGSIAPILPARNATGAVAPFGASGELAAYEYRGGYRVGAGDQLAVTVFGEPDLTNTYTVDGSGAISMPLVHTVPVAGMNTPTIEKMIAARLRQGFLRNPSVSVQLTGPRPFFILGEVTSAGGLPYQSGMTVQNAVALAGGYSPRANHGEVLITRKTAQGTTTHQAPVTTQVFPGDIIYVRERWF